jgi:hypothetical protein
VLQTGRPRDLFPIRSLDLSTVLNVDSLVSLFFCFLGWSGTESTIIEATTGHYWPIVPAPDDDGCGAIGGMLGRGN